MKKYYFKGFERISIVYDALIYKKSQIKNMINENKIDRNLGESKISNIDAILSLKYFSNNYSFYNIYNIIGFVQRDYNITREKVAVGDNINIEIKKLKDTNKSLKTRLKKRLKIDNSDDFEIKELNEIISENLAEIENLENNEDYNNLHNNKYLLKLLHEFLSILGFK